MTSSDETKPRRPGRPVKYPGEGKRPTLTFRVRGGLHEQLQNAAAKSGRSLSEEIERRVEQSFAQAEEIEALRRSRDEMREITDRNIKGLMEIVMSSQREKAAMLGIITGQKFKGILGQFADESSSPTSDDEEPSS